jgi:hypothetical protein
MIKAVSSSAMSSMAMVMLYSKRAEQGLEGMSLNTHSHPIALAAAALGSRSNASLNRPLW